jgi:hypothetical protein
MSETKTFTIAPGGTQSTSIVDGVSTTTGSLNIENNTTALLYTMRFLADAGYHYSEIPSYTVNSSTSQNWSVTIGSQAYNSYGQLKDITFSFYYSMGEEDIPITLGEQVTFADRVIAADLVKYNSISGVYYTGYKNESILPAKTLNVILNVTGTEGSTYEVKIEDSNGLTYDFVNETFSRQLNVLTGQQIKTKQASILAGQTQNNSQYTIVLPSFFEGEAYDYNFTTTVTPTGTTKTSTSGSTKPLVVKLNQFGDIDFALTIAAASDGTYASDASIKSILNSKPLKSLSTFNPVDFPELSSKSNGYFTHSTNLQYGVIASTSAATTSGRVLTFGVTTSSLKLRVGDIITGGTITNETTTIASLGTNTVTMSADAASYPIAIDTSINFKRVVGISRQPNANDIKATAPIVSYYGLAQNPTYMVDNVDGTIVTLSTNNEEDIAIGMLVEGDNIVGFPTVTSVAGNNITLSKKQNLSKGDSLSFSIAGSSITIESINVTGINTTLPKLNVSGYVERVGIADVTAEVVLDNFVEPFVANALTAVATTATCFLGGSVVITPLDVNSSSTGELTIASIPSSGSGATSLSTDSKSIKYKAPTVGTTDTITYTINDGISTSAAANIVITLIP